MISYNKKKLFPLLCLILVACFAVISAGCGSSSNSGGKKSCSILCKLFRKLAEKRTDHKNLS
jgi:hypothetical protein